MFAACAVASNLVHDGKPLRNIRVEIQGKILSTLHKGNVAHVPTQAQPVGAAASGKNPDTNKTQRELDEELRQRMEGISGEGGESGVEYEDGKPVAMKRSVRENMFRYI